VSHFELVSDQPPQAIFAGRALRVTTAFRNSSAKVSEADLRFRLYQASAATLMPLAEAKPWKTLMLPSGQTALDNVQIELPAVRTETMFHIAWFEGQKKLGTTLVRAFPDDLLKPLAMLAGDTPLGLLDLEGKLGPGFRGVPLKELKDPEDVAGGECSLIIIAPISPRQGLSGLAAAVKRKASGGGKIVWIQRPAIRQPDPAPATYVVEQGNGTIVVAPASMVSDFGNSPLAQLSLVVLAELATGRRKLDLPSDPHP
jgi:hypothetical protein